MKAAIFGGLALAAAALASGLTSVPAEARIVCKGQSQVMSGGRLLPTPYCQDAYLAKVARSRGMRVSAAAIRNNVNLKEDVCRFIGHDTRVMTICSRYMPSPGGNKYN